MNEKQQEQENIEKAEEPNFSPPDREKLADQEQLTMSTRWDKEGVAECIDKLWDRPDEEALRQKIAGWIGYQQGRMVDVGCGTARIATLFPASGPSYIGIDPSREMVALASEFGYCKSEEIQVGSGDNLLFEDQSVPTVLCSQVFRHLTTYGPTLKEIARIAKRRVFLVDIFSAEPTETSKTEICGQEFVNTTWSLDDVLADISREFPGWSVEKKTFDVPFIVGLKLEAPKQ